MSLKEVFEQELRHVKVKFKGENPFSLLYRSFYPFLTENLEDLQIVQDKDFEITKNEFSDVVSELNKLDKDEFLELMSSVFDSE